MIKLTKMITMMKIVYSYLELGRSPTLFWLSRLLHQQGGENVVQLKLPQIIFVGKLCDIYTSDNSDGNDDYNADKSDNDENPTSASETGDHLYFLDFPP